MAVLSMFTFLPLGFQMCSLSLSLPKDIFFLVFKVASPSGVVKMETLAPLGCKNRFGPVGGVEAGSLSTTRLWVIWLCPSEVTICHCLPHLLCAHCTSCSLSFEMLSSFPLQTLWVYCLGCFHSRHWHSGLGQDVFADRPVYQTTSCTLPSQSIHHMTMDAVLWHLSLWDIPCLFTWWYFVPQLQSILSEVGILSILFNTL